MKFLRVLFLSGFFLTLLLSHRLQAAEPYRYVKTEGRELLTDFDKNGTYEPYFIKGAGYSPYPIGRHPSDWGWGNGDSRKDNILDDKNILNRDFALLQEMNANTIRVWKGNNTTTQNGQFPVKLTETTLDVADQYGIKVIAGFWINTLGEFTCSDSGKIYNVYLDITDADVREDILTRFGNFVAAFKNHQAILFWAIGNENNYQLNPDDEEQVQAWYSLVDEMAQRAHEIEGSTYHPVAVVNGDMGYIGESGVTSDDDLPHVDIWGSNIYRGKSFGALFSDYQSKSDKPLWIAEFGTDAWHSNDWDNPEDGQEDQATQAEWAGLLWDEIADNSGVTIGGTVMEYADEWWKPWEWLCGNDSSLCNSRHDYYGTGPVDDDCPKDDSYDWYPASKDNFDNAEWWGIMAIQKASQETDPDVMIPRAIYDTLQEKFSKAVGSDGRAQIKNPINGSTLDTSTVTFQWTKGNGVKEYWLGVATSQDKLSESPYGDIYAKSAGTNTSALVTGIPLNGETIYVRLWSKIGCSWLYNDYSYATENADDHAVMINPTNGSTLDSSSITFTWTTGTGVSAYFLSLGTVKGTGNIYSKNQGTNTSITVTGIPLNGKKVFARLWSKVNNKWTFEDYEYLTTLGGEGTEHGVMISPVNGSTLESSSVTFTWTTGTGVSSYFLYIGTTKGGTDIYAQSQGTTTSVTVSGMPQDGKKVYVRLWSKIKGTWQFEDYSYLTREDEETEHGVMISPVNGSTLGSSSITFSWTTGTGVSAYYLYVGTTKGGTDIYAQSQGTAMSVTVNGIPQDGKKAYVRLWSRIKGTWQFEDYSYLTQESP